VYSLVNFFIYESTDDAFIAGDITAISSRIDGHVIAVNFRDNQPVNKGYLLVEIDPCDLKAKLDLAEASVVAAEAAAEQSKAQIAAAAAEAERSEKDVKRYQVLEQGKWISQQQLDNATAAYRTAAAQLDAANKQLAVSQARVLQEKALSNRRG